MILSGQQKAADKSFELIGDQHKTALIYFRVYESVHVYRITL